MRRGGPLIYPTDCNGRFAGTSKCTLPQIVTELAGTSKCTLPQIVTEHSLYPDTGPLTILRTYSVMNSHGTEEQFNTLLITGNHDNFQNYSGPRTAIGL